MRRWICVRLIMVVLVATATVNATGSATAEQENVFTGALHAGTGALSIVIVGGDPKDPFEEGHPAEAGIYRSIYYGYYHALFTGKNAPVIEKLPAANDKSGRPLWFDGGQGGRVLAQLVTSLLERSQFDDLDKLFQDWSDPSERLADGRAKITMFDLAISSLCQTTECWPEAYKKIERWRQTNKKSPAAANAEVVYWTSYAWNARGGGYVDAVDPDAWPLFRERLNKAQTVLDESKSYAQGPSWTQHAIEVGMARSLPVNQLIALYSERADSDHFFSPIYISMEEALEPKWGGDWRRLDAFVNSATQNTMSIEGNSMYARLYWHLLAEDVNLFSDTLASWPLMKKGFEDMMKLYPHSAINLNRYAAAACVAQDKETFQDVMFRLGNHFIPDVWPSNHSIDLCIHKYERRRL